MSQRGKTPENERENHAQRLRVPLSERTLPTGDIEARERGESGALTEVGDEGKITRAERRKLWSANR
jgi:mannose/cellobiose epimerase-like protein (N-acyl-D-glucosamine 2-epimerase family)